MSEKSILQAKHYQLDLPDLAVERLFQFLDSQSLAKLRRINNQFKFWIETSSSLKNLPVYIESDERITQVISSQVKWKNFVIKWSEELSTPAIYSLLRVHSPHLKRVKIEIIKSFVEAVRIEDANILLNLGPKLESLHLSGIVWDPTELMKLLPLESTFQKGLKANMSSLKELHIEECYPTVDPTESIQLTLQILLMNAPNLTSITIPITVILDLNWGSANSQNENTLSNYIREVVGKKSTSFQIKFCPKWYESLAYFPTLIQERWISLRFLGFLNLCSQFNVKLFNVPLLPVMSNAEIESNEELAPMLNKCITNILCRDHPEGLKHIYVPPNALVSICITEGALKWHDFSKFEIPQKSIKIDSISLNIDWTCDSDEANVLYLTLLQRVRPTVSKLSFTFPTFMFGERVELALSQLFPNLRVLHVSGTPAQSVPNLLRGLSQLEELKFLDCHLNDESFQCGRENQNLLLNLKRLTTFQIEECLLVGFTDLTFQNSLQYMALKKFKLTPKFPTNPWSVTFKNGVSTLCQVPNFMENTLEVLECYVPKDSSLEDMKRFSRNFKNLRKSTFYPRIKLGID